MITEANNSNTWVNRAGRTLDSNNWADNMGSSLNTTSPSAKLLLAKTPFPIVGDTNLISKGSSEGEEDLEE